MPLRPISLLRRPDSLPLRLSTRNGIGGFSLLETLVMLLIGTPLLMLLLMSITQSIEVQLRASTLRVENESLQTVRAILGAAVEHSASHRLPVEPRIHPPGQLTFVDGALHPLMTHTLYRPDVESTALSMIELDFEAALSVQGRLPDGSWRVCSRWGPLPQSDSRLFLAVSIDGLSPIGGSLSQLPGSSSCFTLVHTLQQSTVLRSRPSVVSFAALVVPVRREYTIYLAANGELRYLSHRGGVTTENQPLLRGLRNLHILATPGPPPLPPTYRVEVDFRSERTRIFDLTSPASSQLGFTLLASRP